MAAFIFLAGIAATAVACALAVSLFILTGWTPEFWLAWRQRVLAHVFPIITITPLIVLTFAGRIVSAQPARQGGYVELALLTGGLLAVCIPVFGWKPPGTGIVPALLLAPLPFLLWAAVRLGPGGLSIALLIVAGASMSNASVGRGPFLAQSPAENVLALQIFLSAISIPLMLLAALVEERRRTEERLKQSEERMAFAATSANIGLWQLDIETGRFWATEHCRSMFALPCDTPLTPDALLDAVHPEDRQAATEGMRRSIHAGVPAAGEFRVLLPDGQTRWIVARGHALDDEQGRPIQVSGVFADITARKKAEQEAEQRMSELAHMNRHATAGELSASIAHEIRQPLAAIAAGGNAGLNWLKRSVPNLDEVRNALQIIVKESHRADDIIKSVRAMFRNESQVRTQINLNELIRQVITITAGSIKSNNIVLDANLTDDAPPFVMADPVQLQQVILNLIMNAVEAMSHSGNWARVLQLRSQVGPAGTVMMKVADSGPSIDPKVAEKMFQPFFTTKPGGMGMGLAICETIIEAHGGSLTASPNKPHGMEFQLVLPHYQHRSEQ